MTVASQVKQTLASLKGVRGNLRIYAAQSQHKEAVSAYTEAIEITEEVIDALEHRISRLEFEEPQYKGL
ncbi:MAG: DUF1657 domain-containing protein [Bacillota bacterium]